MTSRRSACRCAPTPAPIRRRRQPAAWGSAWRPAHRPEAAPPAAAGRPTGVAVAGGGTGLSSATAHFALRATPELPSPCRPLRSSDEVDGGEQRDPDDVDEVPVVGDNDRRGGLRGGELAHRGAREQIDERDKTADDVQTVE